MLARPYDGRSRRASALKTALRVVTGSTTRRFPITVINELDSHIAFEREIRQEVEPQKMSPNVRLPWRCRIVVARVSVKSGLRDLWGRGAIFFSDGAYCPMEYWEDGLIRPTYLLEVVLLGTWIDELRIHERQTAEIQKLL